MKFTVGQLVVVNNYFAIITEIFRREEMYAVLCCNGLRTYVEESEMEFVPIVRGKDTTVPASFVELVR